MFEVLAAASDRTLLTIAELRDIAGVDGPSRDSSLRRLGNYIAAAIVSACRVTTDGAIPPTLRLESVRDTFRSRLTATISAGASGRHMYRGDAHTLELSRRPVIDIASVIENDVLLDPTTDYLVSKAGGLLTRLVADVETCWRAGKIVVEYSAGWSTVPDDLKFAATKFVQLMSQQAGRDPLLRRESVPGVLDQEWWVEPTREIGVPPEVFDLLERGGFVNQWHG